jgi:hypothetical protein
LIAAWCWVIGNILNEADFTLGVAVAGKLPVLVRLDLGEAKTLCELAGSVPVHRRSGDAQVPLQDLATSLREQQACRVLFAYGATELEALAVAEAASKAIARPLIQLVLWPK